MKKVLVVILLIGVFIVAGYFGLPLLIDRETAELKADVQDLKMRLQKIEEESKAVPLKPDADVQKVIKTVNAIYHKVNSLEDSFKKGVSATVEAIKKQGKVNEEALKKQAEALEKQKTATEEALKKQAETIDKLNKEIEAKIQKIMFDAAMATIRGHILKARVELVAKNVGTARSELDLVDELFSKAAVTASDENKKAIKELQVSLKKAKADIDIDLPSAIIRIDLLWHEMSKLLRKA
jgi:Ni,Fe-hydrogenase I large subunit